VEAISCPAGYGIHEETLLQRVCYDVTKRSQYSIW
jgi:hypothetical protein